ncbi:MAG: hypothetical protein ACO1RX_20690 [Candidatus Sericytochromatia bacterium]
MPESAAEAYLQVLIHFAPLLALQIGLQSVCLARACGWRPALQYTFTAQVTAWGCMLGLCALGNTFNLPVSPWLLLGLQLLLTGVWHLLLAPSAWRDMALRQRVQGGALSALCFVGLLYAALALGYSHSPGWRTRHHLSLMQLAQRAQDYQASLGRYPASWAEFQTFRPDLPWPPVPLPRPEETRPFRFWQVHLGAGASLLLSPEQPGRPGAVVYQQLPGGFQLDSDDPQGQPLYRLIGKVGDLEIRRF